MAKAALTNTNIIKLKYMSTDPASAPPSAKTLMQGWEYEADEPLLDGPISRRVAVIDLDPETGSVMPGARFVRPKGASLGYYELASELDAETPTFMQVSVFGAVMKMMRIFEEPDVLGRKLRWAFKGEQLLVVPRAGKTPNAFYHRDSRSLQFFFVDDPARPGKLVYSCLSPNIVAHETTHAILDGIAPDLYDSTSPQALALHEAIADLGAVSLAVQTPRLLRQVMDNTRGDIEQGKAFSEIARQFGEAIYGEDRPLRDLANKISLREPNGLDLTEPHDLSLVLTGALYALLVAEYKTIWDEDCQDALAKRKAKGGAAPTAKEMQDLRFPFSGFALVKAAGKFRRIAFRALDYLPPGEISFADYGRAMVAADAYSNPDDPEPREFIKQEFEKRGMVEEAAALDPIPPDFELPDGLDLVQLRDSDWAAYQFSEAHRDKLMIPPNISFDVRPRLDVTRTTWHTEGKVSNRALLFKVAWQGIQTAAMGDGISEVAVLRGTTLAIDWETRKVTTLLTTNPDHASQQDGSTQTNNQLRTAFAARNIAEGIWDPNSTEVQIREGRLNVRSTGQMLHMAGHEHAGAHDHE